MADRSHPLRHARAGRAARRRAQGAVRRRQARPAGRASFLHLLRYPRRRREDVAAPARAISGGDDHHPAAPVLGSGGAPRTASRSACRSAALPEQLVRAVRGDQGLLRSVGAVRPAIRERRSKPNRRTNPPPPAPSRRNSTRNAPSPRQRTAIRLLRRRPARARQGPSTPPIRSRTSRPAAPKSCGSTASARNSRAVSGFAWRACPGHHAFSMQ